MDFCFDRKLDIKDDEGVWLFLLQLIKVIIFEFLIGKKLKLPIIFDNDWTVHKSVMCHIMVTGHARSRSEWPLLLSWINGSVSSG